MIKLETNRLILREWQSKDIEDLVEGLNNIEVSRWLAYIPCPYTERDAKEWISFCISNAENDKRKSYQFAIELKDVNKVIGGTSLDNINAIQGTAGGGIWINEKYHGQGFGMEAFNKRIDFAFNNLKLRRLDNGFFEGNKSSSKMQEKLGYKIEGKRRKGFLCLADGQHKDEIITGLLKEEWLKKEN